jgi:hypothetical protein
MPRVGAAVSHPLVDGSTLKPPADENSFSPMGEIFMASNCSLVFTHGAI